jgi:hypothetical protein
MTEEGHRGDAYDRVIGTIDGLPDVRKARPSTVVSTTPLLGRSQTYVVQTYKDEEGFFGFVQMVDAEGRARLVLPPKVMAALYRQRDALIRAGRSSRGRERWANLTPEQREANVARLRRKGGAA